MFYKDWLLGKEEDGSSILLAGSSYKQDISTTNKIASVHF